MNPFEPHLRIGGEDGTERRIPLSECSLHQAEQLRDQIIRKLDIASSLGNGSLYQQLESMLYSIDGRIEILSDIEEIKRTQKKPAHQKVKLIEDY